MNARSMKKSSRNQSNQPGRVHDADIVTSDIPPLGDEFFRHAKLRMPTPKASITIRVDRDVIDWFKSQGTGYQTRINAILRMYMEAQRR